MKLHNIVNITLKAYIFVHSSAVPDTSTTSLAVAMWELQGLKFPHRLLKHCTLQLLLFFLITIY